MKKWNPFLIALVVLPVLWVLGPSLIAFLNARSKEYNQGQLLDAINAANKAAADQAAADAKVAADKAAADAAKAASDAVNKAIADARAGK